MFKSLAILTLLQVFALGCETDLKMTVVQRPKLTEEYCLSNPDKYGCPGFMDSVRKEKAFKLAEIGPINSSQDQVVRFSGGSFDEHLKLTIEGARRPACQNQRYRGLLFYPKFRQSRPENRHLKKTRTEPRI